MNTKLNLSCLVLAFLGLFSACGGGGGDGGGGGSVPGSAGTIQLGATVYEGAEGSAVNIFVTRSGGNAGAASVNYAITDGTALFGSDYEAVNGSLTGTISYANQSSGNFTIGVRILDDGTAEGPESFTLTLSNVSGATLGANSSATISIIDNETAAISAFGPITDLNSATVNGVRYDTTSTSVYVNGLPATVSDLKVGQLVAVQGDVNFSSARGTANQIDYYATVIGPIESVDATVDRLLVMGQTVMINSDTVFDASIDPQTFAGLAIGTTTQISGFRNANGEIIATRIEPDSTNTDVRLVGIVSGLDQANMMFSINRLVIDYGSATLIDLPVGMPTEGLLVFVHGSLTNGILVVNEIGSVNNLASTPGARVHLGGVVTRFASATDLDLNGFPITTNVGTDFVNGVVGDLQVDAEVTIDGEVGTSGGAVVANEVTIGRPVDDRSTQVFDFEDFTNISVHGLSRVTIEQGTNFSVEVIAPSIGNVQVTQNGDTVTFGDNSTLFLNAFVTMPVLNRIDVETGSLANVTLRDFEQTHMTATVGGVSRLRGEGLQIGELTAAVSGVSMLDFGSIRPIGNASVDVSGVSQAVLNMQVGSTLTGSVRTGQGTGHSVLYYYGTNVNTDVTTDALSRVTRLGDTRP